MHKTQFSVLFDSVVITCIYKEGMNEC